MSILEVPIVAALVIIIMYNLCMTVIANVNLHRLSHGEVKVVTSLHEYIKYLRRMVK